MEIAVAALVILAAIAWLLHRQRARPAASSPDPILRLHGSGRYEFAVVGTSRYHSELQAIYGDDDEQRSTKEVEAVLIPEGNKQDKNAVRVDVEGRTVGYLPGDLAREYRRRLNETGYPKARGVCKARITLRLHQSIGGHADFAVRLDLPSKR